jgi:hypothetical protein
VTAREWCVVAGETGAVSSVVVLRLTPEDRKLETKRGRGVLRRLGDKLWTWRLGQAQNGTCCVRSQCWGLYAALHCKCNSREIRWLAILFRFEPNTCSAMTPRQHCFTGSAGLVAVLWTIRKTVAFPSGV